MGNSNAVLTRVSSIPHDPNQCTHVELQVLINAAIIKSQCIEDESLPERDILQNVNDAMQLRGLRPITGAEYAQELRARKKGLVPRTPIMLWVSDSVCRRFPASNNEDGSTTSYKNYSNGCDSLESTDSSAVAGATKNARDRSQAPLSLPSSEEELTMELNVIEGLTSTDLAAELLDSSLCSGAYLSESQVETEEWATPASLLAK